MIPFLLRIPASDRRIYTVDVISAAYYGLFLGFFAPFVPVMLKRMGATPFQLGIALAAPFLALLASFPLFRFVGSKKALDLVTIPSFFSRFSVSLIGISSTPEAVLALYVLVQFVEGFGLPAYIRVLKEMYSDSGRNLAVGYIRTNLGFFMILASILGGKLIDSGNVATAFLLSGICGTVSSWNFRRIFLPGQESPIFSAKSFSFRDVFHTNVSSNKFLWLNVTIGVFGFGLLLLFGVLPTLLVEKFQISNSNLGKLNGITNLVQVFCFMLLGWVNSKYGPQKGMFLGLFAGLTLPWWFLLAPSVEYLIVPYFLTGIVFASFDLCWMLLVISYAPKDEIGKFSSVYTLILGTRGVIAMLFANLTLPYLGPTFFLVCSGILSFLGLSISILSRRKWAPDDR